MCQLGHPLFSGVHERCRHPLFSPKLVLPFNYIHLPMVCRSEQVARGTRLRVETLRDPIVGGTVDSLFPVGSGCDNAVGCVW